MFSLPQWGRKPRRLAGIFYAWKQSFFLLENPGLHHQVPVAGFWQLFLVQRNRIYPQQAIYGQIMIQETKI
ncbi:hypothetical protein D1356_17260 [Escherichia coli]|nr:hypothetical protein [Escherichia coli]